MNFISIPQIKLKHFQIDHFRYKYIGGIYFICNFKSILAFLFVAAWRYGAF